MKPATRLNLSLRRHPPYMHLGVRTACGSDFCRQAARMYEAVELIQLGGRAGLVSHITGIEKKTVKRLCLQLRGTPSPPGQMPFSDAWFLGNDLRMLHATVVWRLHRRLTRTGRGKARILIDVYMSYLNLVREPLLDLMHAAFVPRLVDMNIWEERACQYCRGAYLVPIVSNDNECPGCRLYHRHRCRICGDRIYAQRRGRRRHTCERCK